MVNLNSLMDYYVLSNDIRIILQKTRRSFEQVFEISLNTSLTTGKFQSEREDSNVYEVISSKIEMIAKKLQESSVTVISEANYLNRCSLSNKMMGSLIHQFEIAKDVVHGQSNLEQIDKAIENLTNSIIASSEEARLNLNNIENEVQRFASLNEQTWLTLSSLRVQLAHGDNIDSNLHSISKKLEVLGEEIEHNLRELLIKIERIRKTLDKSFDL